MSDYNNKLKCRKKAAKKKARTEKMKNRRAAIRKEAQEKREIEKLQWKNRSRTAPIRNPQSDEQE